MELADAKKIVLMHGPSFDGSGEIVERSVVQGDVPAYRQAGYELGGLPESVKLKKEVAELKESAAPKKKGKG
jgi:hypothetical protein